MQKKSNFEKTLLTLMALVALGVSGYLVYLSQGFSESLSERVVASRKEMGEVPLTSVQEATKLLGQVFNWASPTKNGKPVPLNKSILVILKGDSLVDLYVPEPKLRDPITNEFLVKNTIPDFLSPNVGDLDPDDDGFTNLEEFKRGTNPKDAKEHPPFTDHLFLKERTADDYILKLNSSQDPYQVILTAPRRDSAYIQPPFPKNFGFKDPITRQINERFEAKGFAKKDIPDPVLGTKDASEMTILDRSTNSTIVLVKGVEKNLADYYAVFEFRHKEVKEVKCKKGADFYIPGVPTKFKLVEIEEANALIESTKPDGSPGEKLPITKR
jgi:hypothetical protein